MAWLKTCIIALILFSALRSRGDTSGDRELSAAEYGAQLDHLISKTAQPNLTDSEIADIQKELPPTWRVNFGSQEFDVPNGWLREDLRKYGRTTDEALLQSDHKKLLGLRADLDGYQKTPPDNSGSRTRLTNILSRREFSSIHGPNWIDRLKQRVILYIFKLLGKAFRSSAIPSVGKYFVYTLVGIAVLALAYWIYRLIRRDAEMERLIPETAVVSAKEWTIWMAEAREAANQGNWRDAIHLAYWAGISFLEGQGTWRPDRARTPREYLRLMPESSERHSTLKALTRSFEVVWYGNREADAQAYSQTLQELEKLGCRPS
jgi:hypothetical protein